MFIRLENSPKMELTKKVRTVHYAHVKLIFKHRVEQRESFLRDSIKKKNHFTDECAETKTNLELCD